MQIICFSFGKYFLIGIMIIYSLVDTTLSQTDIPAGNVSGVWTKLNSPYHINGEITIPNDSTLVIEPGVEVVFKGHYKLNVQGRLLAIGTQMDSIFFTSQDSLTGWHGIRFNSTPNTNDTSKIVNCSFKYGNANTGTGLDRCGGAIMISRFDKIIISDCLFDSNTTNGDPTMSGGAAIYIEWASSTINNNTFSNHIGISDGAILCTFTSNAVISHNVFCNNKGRYGSILCGNSYKNKPIISGNIFFDNLATTAGGGIFAMQSNALIINNIFYHNYACEGGGIKFYLMDISICINNTFVFNNASTGGGVCFNDNSNPVLINNIIWGNTSNNGAQVSILDNASDPHFFFNDIQGGKEEFKLRGTGNNFSGTYKNNINMDPLFVNEDLLDFHLSDFSPCIGAGTDSAQVGNECYGIPPLDMEGNPRCNLTEICDLGAYENPLTTPLVGVERDMTNPEEFILYQNYPNPFNLSTVISYSAPGGVFGSQITLKVYDVLGNEIATLVNEEKPAGIYEIIWNAEGLSSGVYFYQLKAGDFTNTKKFLLMK